MAAAERGVTRRRALAMLATSAGAAAAVGRDASATAWLGQGAPQSKPPTFPPGAVIRTLLRDVPPGELAGGPILFHEHLSMHYPPQAKEHFTDDVAMMVDEARAARRDGIALIVDGGHADMSRSLDALKRIATESGLPIVGSGGYYMQRTYPAAIATTSADEIAAGLVREAGEQHLGAFGEIGQQGGSLTEDEKKVFEAVAKAQAQTGLPIFTHNAYTGTRPAANPVPPDAALRQLDVLERAGATPDRVAVGHVCCLDDPKAGIAQQIAARGAFVGFDRVTIPIVPDAERVLMIIAMVEAGHADRVLISSDFAVAASLKKNGGGGLAQAASVFGPMLLKAGLAERVLHQILVDNPRRFLAFVPRGETPRAY
jgi:phosphotriesterase-related protein